MIDVVIWQADWIQSRDYNTETSNEWLEKKNGQQFLLLSSLMAAIVFSSSTYDLSFAGTSSADFICLCLIFSCYYIIQSCSSLFKLFKWYLITDRRKAEAFKYFFLWLIPLHFLFSQSTLLILSQLCFIFFQDSSIYSTWKRIVFFWQSVLMQVQH